MGSKQVAKPSRRRACKRYLPWTVGILVFLLALTATDYAVKQRAKVELDAYASDLLKQAESVSLAIKETLGKAKNVTEPVCSVADLNELRILAFSAPYVRDVGRIRNGRFLCSASWGVLSPAVLMPVPDLMGNGYQFWGRVRGVLDNRIRADMTAFDGVIVSTSPRAFDHVAGLEQSSSALVTVSGGNYIFESFGDVSGFRLSSSGGAEHMEGFVTSRTCSGSLGLCVVARSRDTGLINLPLWQFFSVLFLSLMGGAGVTVQLASIQRRRSSIEQQLVRAIRKNEIDVVYQPLRRLRDRKLVGAEALARWKDDDGREVRPDEFIPILEKLGLTAPLAKSVILKGIRDLGDRLRGEELFYVSVNLAAEDLRTLSFREFIANALDLERIKRDRVVLEVTERSTIDREELINVLDILRDDGFRVYIDDFGTGYSNFSYLSDMAVSGLKMDRQFTRAVGTMSVANRIVETICAMARSLEIDFIAEGVETEEQALAVLRLVPSAIGQGWLLGRPCKPEGLGRESREIATEHEKQSAQSRRQNDPKDQAAQCNRRSIIMEGADTPYV